MNAPVCVVCDGRIGCEFCPGGYVPEPGDVEGHRVESGQGYDWVDVVVRDVARPWDEVSIPARRPWA